MPRTLYARLAVTLALILLAVGATLALLALQATQLFAQELDQRFNRDLARQLLVQRDLVGGELLDQASVKALFSHYMHINPAIEIYLLDKTGKILAFEAPQMRIKRERVDLAPIRNFLAGAALPVLGDDPRDEQRRKVFSAAPFPLKGEPQQYLYVVLGGEAIDSSRAMLRDSYLARFSLTAVAAVVLFGFLTGALAFHLLTRRLHRLAGAMEGFRASGLRGHQIYSGSGRGDEIDRLGESFNLMAERIEEQLVALEQKETLRRHLVANVSHDLRTPLAALRGYLETLRIKGDSLPLTERERYLKVAHHQSERLTRLVEELFELSKLEAQEGVPQREPALIGELMYDVAQKFALKAAERQVALEIAPAADLPLVSLDVAMMDRVLTNLLENALAQLPNGGRITLAAYRGGDGVVVQITDTGAGISAADLPHLFDRFYQAPDRRGRGAGLGLAIVRRILELHGGSIAAESRPGATTFRFVLPHGAG